MSSRSDCDFRVKNTKVRTIGYMLIPLIVVSLLFPILIYAGVFESDDCLICYNETVYVTQNRYINVYQCRSNLTIGLPAWYEIDVSDEMEDLMFIYQEPQYGQVAIYSIDFQMFLINYTFANKFYNFTDEGEADTWLAECEANRTQIGFEQRDLYLRSPQYFDEGDVYLNDRISETFEMPLNKFGVIAKIIIHYKTWGFEKTDTMYTTINPANRTSPLNFWRCENKNLLITSLTFNRAGQYLEHLETTITSSYLASEVIVWDLFAP